MGQKSLPTPVCPSCQGLFELGSSQVPPLGSRYRLTQFWNAQGPQSCKAWSNPDWSPWKGLHWRKRIESSTIAPAAEKPAPVPPPQQNPGCGLQEWRGAWGSGRATTAPRGSLWSWARWAWSCLQEASPLLPPRSSGLDCQRAPSPATSHIPSTGPAPAMPTHCTRPIAVHSFIVGPKTFIAWRVPHPKHRTLLPTGQILCMPPETHTLLWGLCLNSLQMQKAQLGVFTHWDKEQLLTAAPAWPPFTPLFLLRQPTSLLFLLSSFPRFCAALPGIPCFTQQPALPRSSPSFSAIISLGFAAVTGTRIKMGKYQPWGPVPFTVSGTGIVLVGDCTKPRGAAFMHALAPSLGPSTLSQR